MFKPVLTLLPVCNSDIATDLPFSVSTVAIDGKQPLLGGGGGGGGGWGWYLNVVKNSNPMQILNEMIFGLTLLFRSTSNTFMCIIYWCSNCNR